MMPPEQKHCKRSTGTERAWFVTREEAEAFARDPANVNYHGDIAHLCAKCGYFHLSKPEWLRPQRNSLKTSEDLIQMLDIEHVQHDYFSLAIAVMLPNGQTQPVHDCDVDRLTQLSKLMSEGGVPFAVLAIIRVPGHGFIACAKLLCSVEDGEKIVQRELQMMADLIREDADFRYVTPECEVVQ